MTGQAIASKFSSIADAAWPLEAGQALRLPIGPGRRELRVLEGRVWVTARGELGRPARDIWLTSGDALSLDSGEELVLEAWPAARFQLLVPPVACTPWHSLQARLSRWVTSLARPGEQMASASA